MTIPIYSYDESGQDTVGKLLVIAGSSFGDPDIARSVLKTIEDRSGKGRLKWANTNDERQEAFIRMVLNEPIFKGNLYYSVFFGAASVIESTLNTVAASLKTNRPDRKPIIMIDGLQGDTRTYPGQLRKRGVAVDRVIGADDKVESLIRLPDALAGFVRDAILVNKDFKRLLQKAENDAIVLNVKA